MIRLKVVDFRYFEDQESFILESNVDQKQEKYFLPFDDTLLRLLRVKRKNQKQEALTPRDIQGMLRSGKDSKTIATEYGISCDWVQKFEPPIVAERNFISYRARSVLAFRNDEDGVHNFSLDNIVAYSVQPYRERGENIKLYWDALHVSGNIWTITVNIESVKRDDVKVLKKAMWSFNSKNTKIIPRNNDALELMSNFENSTKVEASRDRNKRDGLLRGRENNFNIESNQLKLFNKNKRNYLINKQSNSETQDTPARVPEWDEVLFGDYL